VIGSSNGRASALFVVVAALAAADLSAQDAPPPAPITGPPARTSWTSDQVDVREGDIVTILIDEFTLASADRDEYASNERDRAVGVSSSFFGANARTVNDVSSSTRGESSRRERFQAEMSTRIVEILPGGVARIEGIRKLEIDDHEQEVTVRGFVRTQDISANNTVDSWRVAQAELLYKSNRELGSNASIWTRLFNLIIP
jgi:flagellar L-ring protein precursor FlgH